MYTFMDIVVSFLHCPAHIVLPARLLRRVCGKAIDTGSEGARREIIFFFRYTLCAAPADS